MADQPSNFTELVQEALGSLPEGASAELVKQDFDEAISGNAVATLDLRRLRFRFVRDRGFVTVDVGRVGQNAESFPLEELAAKLEWLQLEQLEQHYGSMKSRRQSAALVLSHLGRGARGLAGRIGLGSIARGLHSFGGRDTATGPSAWLNRSAAISPMVPGGAPNVIANPFPDRA